MEQMLEAIGAEILAHRRIVIAGVPRSGKTTLAKRAVAAAGYNILHCDDLIDTYKWSELSEEVAARLEALEAPWIVEGVAAVRALRKFLDTRGEQPPVDAVVFLDYPLVELSKGQASMAKGAVTIWSGLKPRLEAKIIERP